MNPNSILPSNPEESRRLQLVLDATSDGIFDWHIPSGECYFSARLYNMLGYEDREFPGHAESWRERLFPEDLAKAEALLRQHFADERIPYKIEFRMRQKDGSWKWILARGKVVEKDTAGRPVRMIGTHIDISERKAAEERYRQLFENLTTGFALHEVVLDDAGKVVDYRFLEVNPAYERLTGLRAEALIGRTVKEVLPEVESLWIDNFGRVALDGTSLRLENYTAPLDRWYETWAYRPADGQFAVLVTDITERKRQEEAVRRSEEQFRFLAENSVDVMLRLDAQGRYLWVSPSIHSLLEIDPESVLGKSSFERIHPDDRDRVARAFAESIRSGSSGRSIYRHCIDAERSIWLESVGKPVFDPRTGELKEFLVASRDVSERIESQRKIEELATFNQQLIDTTGGIIVVFDRLGRIQRFNHAAEELLGWKEEEVLGKPYFEVFVPEPRRFEVAKRFPGEFDIYEASRFESDWLARDGSIRWIAWATSPILSDGGSYGYVVCTGLDRTLQRKAEQDLVELNASLERKVQERTSELQTALKELETFSYSISHDLRSPLRAIDGFSLALIEDAGTRLAPELRNYLDRIRSASTHMAHLIDDLLELSRSSRVEIRKSEVDLGAIAHEILEGLHNQNPERSLFAKVDPGIRVQGDPVLVRSILDNLLGNSWKYSSTREEAVIEVTSEIVDGRRWVQVKDNGIGFDMEHAGKLFGTFQRLHQGSRFEGTGIGLATVRKLVERHGGAITGSGIPDNGAVFRFTLDPLPERSR